MLHQVRAALIIAALPLATLMSAPQPAHAQPGVQLRLDSASAEKVIVPVGKSRVFTTTRDISRLVLGNPDIADVVLLSPRSFYVLGQNHGQTNLLVFADEDFPAGVVDLEVSVDTDDLASALRGAVPSAHLHVESVNGRLRLSGTVPDAVALSRVLDIAGQYGSDSVINALQVASPQQVFLEVRMIEASREAGKSLGISIIGGDTGSGNSSIRANTQVGSLIANLVQDGLNIELLIEALESRGLARSLAEPTLAALSGETASFLAGGEVPIPIPQEGGVTTIEYKEFGVRLNFTPIVLENGLINLRLEPEVSQVGAAGVGETPSFTTRRASTTVELHDGQSFAVAGLLQRNNSRSQSQVPWLGDIPVLGALFRSASFRKEETDLVIIVTPRLSRPATPSRPLRTPLDYSVVTSERVFFLYGIQEISRAELTQELQKRGIEPPFGHVIDDSYIAGAKYVD